MSAPEGRGVAWTEERDAIAPQEAVERALQAATSDDCVVIAEETSAANLRWASNTLTTNGISRSRRLTVIAISRDGAQARAGVVSRAGVGADQIADVVAEAERAAAEASPAEDAQELPGPASGHAFGKETQGDGAAGTHLPSWEDPPGGTEIGVLSGFAGALGDAFGVAAGGGRRLYGFAEHSVNSLFLGSSSGLRLRHDQLSGKVELNAKSAGSSCPPGVTRRCCRRAPSPTSSSTCTGRPGRRMRWTAGRCSAGPGAAPGSGSGSPPCRSRCAATRARLALNARRS